LLDLKHVPVLYEGIWRENLIKRLYKPIFEEDPMEGYVVRLEDSFTYGAFKYSVAKYVNGQFNIDVKNRHPWIYQAITPNERKMIRYEYDGKYPNLCSGALVVYVGDRKFEFERGSLRSGGAVKKIRKEYKIIEGNWYIDDRKWPEDFPSEFKEFLVYKINTEGQIPLPCCGGCS
jgi:hypothetical protein